MTSETIGNNSDMPQLSALPTIYLFTGYFNNNSPRNNSKLTFLPNTIVFVESPEDAEYNPKKPITLRTDNVGRLCVLKGDGELQVRQLFHSHKNRPIIIPPADTVNFLASAKGKDWQEEMINIAKKNSSISSIDTLNIQSIPFQNLRKPNQDNADDSEKNYSDWYDKQNPEVPLRGYVLAKTRAIIFIVNTSLPVDVNSNVEVFGPKKEIIQFEWLEGGQGGYRMGVVTGTDVMLPEGLYRVEIPVDPDYLNSKKSQWNTLISKVNSEGKYVYRISEMARFDITNAAGEFEIINCNPISIEEALINQYPRFYGHLLMAAKTMNGSKTSISTTSKKPSEGFLDYCTNWSIIKGKSQLAAKLIATDLGVYDTDSGNYNGKHTLSWSIGKALHSHLVTTEDTKVKATLDMVFSTKDGVDAWAEFRAARKDYLDALAGDDLIGWKEALKNNYFKIPAATAEDLAKYERSLAGKIGVPKVALDIFGKALNLLDMYENVSALGKSGYNYFTDTLPNYKKSKDHYKAIAKDYFYWLSAKQFEDSIELHSLFDLNSFEVKPTAKAELIEKSSVIITSLETDKSRKIYIGGHTCDLGSYSHNLSLSKQRAQAVLGVLVEAGVDRNRMEAEGYSYDHPQVPNNSIENREKNRRVMVLAYTSGEIDVSPSREGMASMERYRNLTVQGSLGLEDQALAMAGQVTDIALGLLSVIPVTAPFAAAIGLAKAGSQVIMSAGAMLDEVLMDNVLANYTNALKKQHTLGRESGANQMLITDLYKGVKNKGSVSNDIQWAAQFRVRAEALSGLVSLLMRASMDSPSDSFADRVKKYHIDVYIENFLLNDKWLYPLNDLKILKMDSYWLFAINEFGRKYNKDNHESKKISFGLDKDNRLTSPTLRKELKATAINRVKNAQPIGGQTGGGYMMSYAPLRNVENHLTTEYQGYFPIHRGPEDILSFAETFKPDYSDYSESNYLHTAVYKKENGKWVSFKDDNARAWVRAGRNGRRSVIKPITPFTPIRVLVVFNEKSAAFLPLSFDIIRVDGNNVEGPKYKELARPLTSDELLPHEQEYVGKVGCVFHPFFQVWDKTYLGFKPMAGDFALALISAESYYKLGHLNNMRYSIRCKVGDYAQVYIPLQATANDGKKITYTKLGHKIEDEIPVSVNINSDVQSSVVNTDYLTNSTSNFDYPTLFKGSKRIRILAKVGDYSPYISSGFKFVDVDWQITDDMVPYYRQEIDEIEGSVSGLKVKVGENSIRFDGFDWNTPVEFIAVASCTSLDKSAYSHKSAEWRKMACDMQMFEERWGTDTEGPKLTSTLYYLGKLKSKTSNHYTFDGSDRLKESNSEQEEFEEVIKILESLNDPETSDLDKKKALCLVGWDKNKNMAENEMNVYAAHFKCQYTSQRLVKVNSIRPFGKGVFERNSVLDTNEDHDSHFEFYFNNFNTAGESGFHNCSIKSYPARDGYLFKFSTPKSFYEAGLPWKKVLPSSDLAEWKLKLTDDAYKKISKPTIDDAEIINWLEEEAKTLEPSFITSFKVK